MKYATKKTHNLEVLVQAQLVHKADQAVTDSVTAFLWSCASCFGEGNVSFIEKPAEPLF